MTGKKIIASVLRRTGLTKEEFFGVRRGGRYSLARAMAIQAMADLGMSTSAIARIVHRDKVTVAYWRNADMRAHRHDYYQAYNDERRAAKVPQLRQPKEQKVKPARPKPIDRHVCFYSEADDALARDLLSRKASNEECIRVLGRSRHSVRNRVRYLDDPAFVERCKERDRRRNKAHAADKPAAVAPKVCPTLLEDARRRAVVPRTLTAWSFGDPAPGYSALDRRNATEAKL